MLRNDEEISALRNTICFLERQVRELKMTLRDRMAMTALAEVLRVAPDPRDPVEARRCAETAYQLADSMLEAREARP